MHNCQLNDPECGVGLERLVLVLYKHNHNIMYEDMENPSSKDKQKHANNIPKVYTVLITRTTAVT